IVVPQRPTQRAALALVNPGADAATIDFEWTAADVAIGETHARLTLAAGAKRALFLAELCKTFPASFYALLRGRASTPVAVAALLNVANAGGESVLAALPGAAVPGGALVPRFASGGGYRTLVYLAGPQAGAASGALRFVDSNGTAAAIRSR